MSLLASFWFWLSLAIIALVAYFSIYVSIPFFIRKGFYAVPNESSNHKGKIPHAAGLIIIGILALSLFLWMILVRSGNIGTEEEKSILTSYPISWNIICILVILMLISFWDDIHPLPVVFRFGVQILAVLVIYPFLPEQVLLGYVPPWFDRVFSLLFLITFTNFFNFMDGIDGISAVESMTIGGGLFLASIFAPSVSMMFIVGIHGLLVAILMGVFFLWNRHPAKIFLGDSGSIPLGFFLGLLLLHTASLGFWELALILPLYYYMDAGLTLLKRLVRREAFWRPHKNHFYKKAIRLGKSHDHITNTIALTNIVLLGASIQSVRSDEMVNELAMLGVSLVAVFLLIIWMLEEPNKKRKATSNQKSHSKV